MCKDRQFFYMADRVKRAVDLKDMVDVVFIINELTAAAEKHQITEWFGFSGYGGASAVFPFFLDTKESLEIILHTIRDCRKHLYEARAVDKSNKYEFAIDSLTKLEYSVSLYINECKRRITKYLF